MHFDFEDRFFDTPTIDSAMSWRERSLLALFVHLLSAVLVFVVPQLQFVKDAAARREQRLAEMVAEQQLAQLQERQDAPDFIFVAPLNDMPALEPPPPEADLSDLDRLAASPSQEEEEPLNDLPDADGNSPDFVVAEDPSIGVDSVVEPGEAVEAPETAVAEPVEGVDDGAPDAPEPEPDTSPGDGGRPADSFLVDQGEASRDTPRDTPRDRLFTERPGTIFRQAIRRLEGVRHIDSFKELQGRTDQYGSDIRFDTKGVDFGSWIRRFRALIYRNWHLPYAIWSMSGHVVLTFNVHRDGTMTDLTVTEPSTVDGFTNSAHNALFSSNPVPPLPPEYPDDTVFFTVIFYFNERPVGR